MRRQMRGERSRANPRTTGSSTITRRSSLIGGTGDSTQTSSSSVPCLSTSFPYPPPFLHIHTPLTTSLPAIHSQPCPRPIRHTATPWPSGKSAPQYPLSSKQWKNTGKPFHRPKIIATTCISLSWMPRGCHGRFENY